MEQHEALRPREKQAMTVTVFGEADAATLAQAERCAFEAEAMLLMADNHKGYGMPVGGVAVYKDKVPPAGVGFDIACGNKAVLTNLSLGDIDRRLSRLADKIFASLSFGIGRKNTTPVVHRVFDDPAWDEIGFLKSHPDLKKKALDQLGTIGSGNHYVDVFADEADRIWVGVHFGSRGLGHAIATHFMKRAGDNPTILDETPHTLEVGSRHGRDYIRAMRLAGDYAYAGRDWVCDTVVGILGGKILEEVHNHHNFAWEETHGGESYWVVRKGATPAFPGQRSFIGSSMGDVSVIVEGVDSDLSRAAFYSTIHGAGRIMSRTKAAGKRRKRVVEQKQPNGGMKKITQWYTEGGAVDFEAVQLRIAQAGIHLRGAGADEAPEVYKKLADVLSHHGSTVKIIHTLRPLIVCMAGGDEFDPYKD
ncbi:RtcB family protein [Paracoccus benzoatiresistens]|uniref:3'-phosphate/5'-hydroxy nucleic acid ligase n=1 Tax=Paracoccus benzoatiresistens TaxID=2997341 RepID=A0ABT4JAF5_9RHOB|nr:RtcB family protein [Paracoccus sp. EF6]MCZ0964117.1 RtcB family protein [Paracoccus sp. EF6]